MAEYFSIPSREAAERFSEAYLDAQRSYYDSLEDREEALEDREEALFEAVRLIKSYCGGRTCRCSELYPQYDCPLFDHTKERCKLAYSKCPEQWPDPEEGGGEDG